MSEHHVTNKMKDVTLWTDIEWPPESFNRKSSVENITYNMEPVYKQMYEETERICD